MNVTILLAVAAAFLLLGSALFALFRRQLPVRRLPQ